MTKESVTILGATGSIGVSTLDVIARHPERFEVFALAANSNWQLLLEQIRAFKPSCVALSDAEAAQQLKSALSSEQIDTEVVSGSDGLASVAAHPDTDTVMAAIVGAAGLESALAAAEAGKKLLLANKESLVMSGPLFLSAVDRGKATLLPIDSEHNAIYQCLPGGYKTGSTPVGIRRVLLTASGGPFLRTSANELDEITPEQAIAHPNWSMGAKISVDSATLMNKGLELIEACWLFGLPPEQITVVVHPQSVVHSMVEYLDGSVLAQMGCPDMRTPIANALAWPERIESGVESLDLTASANLQFEEPDLQRFPCLGLAMAAASAGAGASVVLNAANEVAVDAFLRRELKFTSIPALIDSVMSHSVYAEPADIEAVKQLDADARRTAKELMRAH